MKSETQKLKSIKDQLEEKYSLALEGYKAQLEAEKKQRLVDDNTQGLNEISKLREAQQKKTKQAETQVIKKMTRDTKKARDRVMMINEMIEDYSTGETTISPQQLADKIKNCLLDLAENLKDQNLWPESELRPTQVAEAKENPREPGLFTGEENALSASTDDKKDESQQSN